ncbi:hypothetical protein, partial [Vibrio sp. Vb0877]|uniref:hypothetical protein n=1 Tax=Vibrio sp. Vb0877 TaxID=2816073 RepID=UPI001A8D9DAB
SHPDAIARKIAANGNIGPRQERGMTATIPEPVAVNGQPDSLRPDLSAEDPAPAGEMPPAGEDFLDRRGIQSVLFGKDAQ